MKSVTTLGKAKEHRKLWVQDENGHVRDILWWGGGEEELPEEGSIFDIAYSLRASTFRGEKQVTLQFEELRVVQEPPMELRRRELEIGDCRLNPAQLDSLPAGILVWAEGADKEKGKKRNELYQSDEFAIYTTPPSPQALHEALEAVKPRKVHVFAVAPTAERTDDFLARLAGLAKFVINQRAGRVTVQDLAAATGQREGAVQIGLEWLAAGGHISAQSEEEAYRLSKGDGATNQYLQKELYMGVKAILQETAAYRAHFSRANLESLFSEIA